MTNNMNTTLEEEVKGLIKTFFSNQTGYNLRTEIQTMH